MSVSEKERKSVIVDLVKCACTDCVCVFNAKQGFERDGRRHVPTITRAAPDASTLAASATVEQNAGYGSVADISATHRVGPLRAMSERRAAADKPATPLSS